jgi:hypothetical protein
MAHARHSAVVRFTFGIVDILRRRICILALLLLPASFSPAATTRYVVKDNPDAAPPYDSWTNAAADIQSAIDASIDGDTVLVSNGVYDTGGIAPNRVAITRRSRSRASTGLTLRLSREVVRCGVCS